MVTSNCTGFPRLHNLDRDHSRQSGFICTSYPLLYAISHFHIHHPVHAPFRCRVHFHSRSTMTPLLSDTKSAPYLRQEIAPWSVPQGPLLHPIAHPFRQSTQQTCPSMDSVRLRTHYSMCLDRLSGRMCVPRKSHSSCVPLTPG